VKLYNTLTRKIEDFAPINPPNVGMYTCGPTVYDYTHIGHLRKYVGDDVLRRVLETNKYQVKQVMNITDVGHLVSDEDSGEDKMEKGARESNRTVWEVAKFYEDYFWQAVSKVNIERPNIVAKATEHIKEQIKLIEKLKKNGFVYITDYAIYFDISKFPSYTKLSGQKLEDKEVGARQDVFVDKQKKNPADFALWFFTVGHFKDHTMRWPSPWGEGFPGWHIECSAMSLKHLGPTITIHGGGDDLIFPHHDAEIVQSENYTGVKFVKNWVHSAMVYCDNKKMSKSLGNMIFVSDLLKKYSPNTIRLYLLSHHYRRCWNYEDKGLEKAKKLATILEKTARKTKITSVDTKKLLPDFFQALDDDLNTPRAIKVLSHLTRSKSPKAGELVTSCGQILGLIL